MGSCDNDADLFQRLLASFSSLFSHYITFFHELTIRSEGIILYSDRWVMLGILSALALLSDW